MDIKYLSDGKKVAVIGKLNNQETIVQEVFVTASGDEVPSGERFVVKSLHDEPVISYKEKQERELAKRVKEQEVALEDRRKKLKEIDVRLEGMYALLKSSTRFVENFDSHDFGLMFKFLSGSIKWVVCDDYGYSPPMKFSDALIREGYDYGTKRFEGIKLLSAFGSSDGNISYKLNCYRDGSGSYHNIYPFETYEEAVEHIKSRAVEAIRKEKCYFTVGCLESIVKMGIGLPDDCKQILKEKLTGEILKRAETSEKEHAENKQKRADELQKISEWIG